MDSSENYDLGQNFSGNFEHLGGLSIPEGVKCKVQLCGDHLAIEANNQEYVISNRKIVSATVQTVKDVQKQYVSSVGGAVAGSLLLGPLGAIIGGAAQKKTITNKTPLLIFAYRKDGGDVQNIVFKIGPWGETTANRFMYAYERLAKRNKATIEL